jgi:hypothetical protein
VSWRNWIPAFDYSRRYGVIGIYKDRALRVVRIYPVPFVRVSIGVRDFRRERAS